MFTKRLKIKIPKVTKCNCGSIASIDYKRLTHDNVLVAIYLCNKCKQEVVKTKTVDFI